MQGKHHGNRTCYIDDRDRELLAAFRKAKERLLRENGKITLSLAHELARKSPTSRFFVSEERASEVIKRYINAEKKGLPLDSVGCGLFQKRRMYNHLYIIYKQIKKDNPDLSHEEIVTMACAHPAEEFYLTNDSTRAILGVISVNHSRHGIISSDRDIKNNEIQ